MSNADCSRRWIAAAVAGLAILGGAALAIAQPKAKEKAVEVFNALVVNTEKAGESSGAGRTEVVHVIIERWSTEEERQTLIKAYDQKGPDGLVTALNKLPPLGTLRTSSSIGWDLHYAIQTPTADGGRRIVIGTDRRIDYWDVSRDKKTAYPFTLIELNVDQDGKGDGRMSLASKISRSPDGKGLAIEHYDKDPVHLQDVHKQRN